MVLTLKLAENPGIPFFFEHAGTFGNLIQCGGCKYKMAALGNRASHKIWREIIHNANSNFSIFQAEALLDGMSFKSEHIV